MFSNEYPYVILDIFLFVVLIVVLGALIALNIHLVPTSTYVFAVKLALTVIFVVWCETVPSINLTLVGYNSC